MKMGTSAFYPLFAILTGMFICSPRVAAQEPVVSSAASTLSVTFSGLRSAKGVLRVTLFDATNTGKGFPDDTKMAKSSLIIDLAKSVPAGTKETTLTFPGLPPGTYAVAAFHDENNNNKMDTHWYGKPKEGSAASNNPRPKMRAPKWSEARFDLSTDGKAITVSLWYP